MNDETSDSTHNEQLVQHVASVGVLKYHQAGKGVSALSPAGVSTTLTSLANVSSASASTVSVSSVSTNTNTMTMTSAPVSVSSASPTLAQAAQVCLTSFHFFDQIATLITCFHPCPVFVVLYFSMLFHSFSYICSLLFSYLSRA